MAYYQTGTAGTVLVSIPQTQTGAEIKPGQVAPAQMGEYVTSNAESEISHLTERLVLTDGMVADVFGQLDAL
jgi:hypothetical protein